MWPYIIGFVVIMGVIVVVTNRRGSTGASRADDLPSGHQRDSSRGDGYISGSGGGDGGGMGGF